MDYRLKKQLLLVIGLVFRINSSHAQEVIATQGDSFSNAVGSLDFTIGETIVETFKSSSNIITQGFHQSSISVIPTGIADLDHLIKVFPNPTSDILIIDTGGIQGLSYQLIDAKGIVLLNKALSFESSEIDLITYAGGMYLLRFIDFADF